MSKMKKMIHIKGDVDPMYRLVDPEKFEITGVSEYPPYPDTGDAVYMYTGWHSEDLFGRINMEIITNEAQHSNFLRAGIKTPFTVISDRQEESLIPFLKPGVDYLMKATASARSLGQLRFRSEDYMDIIKSANKSNAAAFNDRWDVSLGAVVEGTNESEKLHHSINRGNIIVQEYTPFKAEYRVLYFRDCPAEDFPIKSREGCGYKAKQSDRIATVLDDGDNSDNIRSYLKTIKKLGDSLPYFTFSIDVYVTEDGEFGVWEMSTQYCVQQKPWQKKIRPLMTNALDYVITNEIYK